MIPIIFIHTGYSEYMEYSLHQARYSNPDSEIILLGDESNDRFDFVIHVNMSDFSLSANKFKKTYKHYSSNPYDYELFCIQRWFVLNEYLQHEKIDQCFVCDTDVMLYSKIETALKPYLNSPPAVIHRGDSYSLGISFINMKCVSDFCEYIARSYGQSSCLIEFKEFYDEMISKYSVGGVSDMYLVERWVKSNKGTNVMNLIEVIDDATFDFHIGLTHQLEDDQYAFRLGYKKIIWKDGTPYCFSYKYQKDIKFHLLHFQGPAKYLMSKYYTGNRFPGKLKLDIKFHLANIAAFWYKTLRIRYRFAWLFKIIFDMKQAGKSKS